MIIVQALAFVLDGGNWITVRTSTGLHIGILQRIGESLLPSLVAVVLVVLIAVPLGFLIGHTGRGRVVAIVASNSARALPTLGLLSLFILLIGVNILPTVIVLVILGIPPMLAGTYAGVESVSRETVDASRAQGMTELQIMARVEWPLAAQLIIGGLRSTVLQVFATVSVASAFAYGGLGRYIFDGLASANYVEMVAGAVLITAIALVLEGILATVQLLAAPRGVPRAKRTSGSPTRTRSQRPGASAPTRIKEGTAAS